MYKSHDYRASPRGPTTEPSGVTLATQPERFRVDRSRAARQGDLRKVRARVRRAMGARTSTQSYSPRTSPHESQALPSLLDAPPSARPASVCHTCLCSAHGRCCLPFAGPRMARTSRLLAPRAPDGCPCTLPRSARCPNPSLLVCRRCGSLTATILGARAATCTQCLTMAHHQT